MIFILDRCYILWICMLIVVFLPFIFSFVEPSNHHFKCYHHYHHHHQYPKDFLLNKYHVYDRGYLLTTLKSTNGYIDTSDSDNKSSGIDDNASTSINHSNNQHNKVMIKDDNDNYNNSFQQSTSNFINQYKLKVFSWASLILIIIFLRPFLPILIFTFYFTVIGNSIIDRLQLLYMYLYQLIERQYHHIMDSTTKYITPSSTSSIHMSTTTIATVTDITPSPTLITSTTPLPILSSVSSPSPLATNNDNMKNKMKNIPRKVFATIYSVLLLACIGRFGFYLVPRIIKESQYVINIVKSEDPYKLLVTFISNSIGFETIARIENLLIKLSDHEALKFAGYFITTTTSTAANAVITGDNSNKILPLQNSITLRFGKLLQFYMTGYLNKMMLLTSKLITNSTSAFINATLGLIFSLMTVWDFPQLQSDIQTLEESRIGSIYKELAPKISTFGEILAKSFEVQILIAMVNCALTTIGLIGLKIKGILFFSLLTLLSSFIPIAGIFIATIPPFIVAMTDFGLLKGLQVIAMVVIVHAVESYLLYPQIYSHKLKLQPILVMSSLLMAEHFAGIPGMFLALPFTLFITNQILFDNNNKKEKEQQKKMGVLITDR